MSTKQTRRTPSFRHHKATGQGFVELDGRRVYLGRFDNPESSERYHRLIAEWLANGRQLPAEPHELTITELIALFWKHVEAHYRRLDESPTFEVSNFRQALRPLRELYGSITVAELGPRALKAVRQNMIDRGWARININKQIGRIRRMFRWGVENELVKADVYHGLAALSGLQFGRSEARESEPVTPVPDATVEATKAAMTPTLAAMVELQRLTGMRPGELCGMTTGDLDTTGTVWVYQPRMHKTAHFGRTRMIFIGPKAQRVRQPFLKRDLQAHVFSPAQSERERLEALHAARKTPLSCGNRPGTNRKQAPSRKPGCHFTTASYGRAIAHACDRALPPPKELSSSELKQWRKDHRWRPNRLRHTFATEVRREHGLEAAQVLLGHAKANTSEIYAERDTATARAVAFSAG